MGSRRSHGGLSLTRRGGVLRAALCSTLFLFARPAPAAAQSTEDYWRSLAAERQPEVVLAGATPPSVPAPIAEALRLFRVYELTGDERAARRAREQGYDGVTQSITKKMLKAVGA